MKKGIKIGLIILVSLAVIFGIFILLAFLKSSEEVIILISILLMIIIILAILVLLLLGLDYEVVKNPKNEEKKFDLTLVGILTKLLMSLILVVGIFFTIEMAYEHFINQEHTAFFQRIVIFFAEGNTNYTNGGSNLSDHIGYLQLLVAVVTIAIGGIALINHVAGKEALNKLLKENEDGIEKVREEYAKHEERINALEQLGFRQDQELPISVIDEQITITNEVETE